MTDPFAAWRQSMQDLADAVVKTGYILAAQGAMSWMFQDNRGKARATLANLPVDQLQAVSVAASALASLADEVAAGKPLG